MISIYAITVKRKKETMNLYKLLLLAFLCCTLDVTAQTHPNLILNGGFEEWRTAGIYEKDVYKRQLW